jgi:hypothetical protein
MRVGSVVAGSMRVPKIEVRVAAEAKGALIGDSTERLLAPCYLPEGIVWK